jgi:hypothetical protein
MATKWTVRQAQAAPVLEEDNGDILAPLRAIKQRYIERAEYLQALGVRPQGNGMYYETAAANVGALIAQ